MRITRQARETLDDVQTASQQVVTTTEYATVALMAVAAVSLVALLAACVALGRVNSGG